MSEKKTHKRCFQLCNLVGNLVQNWIPRKKIKTEDKYIYQSLIGFPKELESQIFSYLLLYDILSALLVNKSWNSNVIKLIDRLVCLRRQVKNQHSDHLFCNLLQKTDGSNIRHVSLVQYRRRYGERSSGFLSQLAKLSNLEVLRLASIDNLIVDEGDQLFSCLTKLKFLELEQAFLPKFKLDRWVTNLVNLQCFAFNIREIEEENLILLIKALSILPHLTEVHISQCITEKKVHALEYLSSCSKLRSLTLDDLSMELEEYEYTTCITQLTQLKFWRSSYPDTAPFLSKLTYLKSFENHSIAINSKAIITSLTHLEELYLSFWSDEDIDMIHTSMPHLTLLTIEYAPDDNVMVLTRLTQLHVLQVASDISHRKSSIVDALRKIPYIQLIARYDYNFQYLENYETKFLV